MGPSGRYALAALILAHNGTRNGKAVARRPVPLGWVQNRRYHRCSSC